LKKANKLVYLILMLLLVAVGVLAFFNRGDVELRRALAENREFQIRINGGHAATVGLQTLLDLDPQEFTTPFATSITASRSATMRGVELRVLLESLEIDTANASHFVVSALDGHYSPLTHFEVKQEELIYICFAMDGEMLKPQNEGGFGPFLMVIRGTRFAQRWCKYVEAVDIITS
jgi:DMSO/TMAO reductase YedYZ molybdopterin-dependent catalytic subunit